MDEANGSVMVYGDESMRGDQVELLRDLLYDGGSGLWRVGVANMVGRNTNGESTIAAMFPNVKPGHYGVQSYGSHYTKVSVFPGEVAEVDWR